MRVVYLYSAHWYQTTIIKIISGQHGLEPFRAAVKIPVSIAIGSLLIQFTQLWKHLLQMYVIRFF